MNRPPPETVVTPAREPGRDRRLEIEHLAVSYHGRRAVADVTLPVRAGGITAVVGPSGCGKSTFLWSLNRLTDLVPGCTVTGRVALDGMDVRDASADVVALRRQVGMIFQKPNPFPLSILKNLTFPLEHAGVRVRRDRDAAAETALRQVGLWDEVRDRLEAPALALSGGQQQRLCLARALAMQPRVLLLDEPCSALDPMASRVVEELVSSLRGRYTIVIVTHNLAQARRLADDVAVFWVVGDAGTVVEYGPAPAVFESPSHELTAAYVRGAMGYGPRIRRCRPAAVSPTRFTSDAWPQ